MAKDLIKAISELEDFKSPTRPSRGPCTWLYRPIKHSEPNKTDYSLEPGSLVSGALATDFYWKVRSARHSYPFIST